jgi:hypothetical protein
VHPEAPTVAPEHWKTTAFNAAWTAALFIDPECGKLVHINADSEEVFATELTKEDMQ